VQPSSLIFVLVIAIWAAYLLQHWLRRREHLSTARTIDRFSASMRVLDRTKAGRPSASGGLSTTGSIPLHRRSTGLAVREVAGGDTMAVPVPDAGATASPSRPGRGRRVAGVTLPKVRMPKAVGAVPRTTRALAAGAGRSTRLRPVLGLAVLGGGLAALVTALAAAFGWLSWAVPLLFALVAVAGIVGLRRLAAAAVSQRMARQDGRAPADGRATAAGNAATSARAATTAPRSSRRPSPRPSRGGRPPARRPAAPGRTGTPGQRTAAGQRGGASGGTRAAGEPAAYGARPVATSSEVVASAGAATASARPEPRDRVFDLASVEATIAAARGIPPEVVGGWSPVPVPPPTYTLKAKAVYAAAVDDDDVVSPYAPVTDLDERRRLASG
jgi:hypothetical protein